MNKDIKIPDIPEHHQTDPSACVFIKPVMKLKEKAKDENSSDFAFDVQAIKKAEMALSELSENFEDWLHEEIERLITERDKVVAENFSPQSVDAFYRASHDLKGQAATLGYPLIGHFCASLCRLIDAYFDKSHIPVLLINQHVDAARAILKEKVTDPSDKKANILLKQLTTVTEECIEHERKIVHDVDALF
ncbi:MAG: Hpt domain-containing protein [Pseudomonadota bacterium]